MLLTLSCENIDCFGVYSAFDVHCDNCQSEENNLFISFPEESYL